MLVYHTKCNSQSWLGVIRSIDTMNNWWSELEILKKTVAEQEERIYKGYARIKELNDNLQKESAERRLLGLSGCPHCGK